MTITQTPTVPDQEALRAAARRIAPFVHRTPVLTCQHLDERAGARLFFKCEHFQKVGAFKMRGAANAVQSLSEAARQKGVATHSSGNHAQAVALAARQCGVPAYIVMPENAPRVKVAAVRDYGAEVTFCAPTLPAREATLAAVVARTGATFVHPYDDYRVVAGQATAAMELLEEVSALAVLLAPVGGGGLLSGTALAAYYFGENVRVVGAEPAEADDAHRSLVAGRLIPLEKADTLADGLRTSLSDKTFGIIRQHVAEILTVSEAEIVAAMRLIWERMKIIIEPSCAVPLAAVLRYPEQFRDQRVGIILTGGNVDLTALPFS